MYPKPTKQSRKQAAQAKKLALQEFRRAQVALAISRDDNRCVFCWFLLGITASRDDVHHVYGRGQEAGDWRERYTCLLCSCRKHHPSPIKDPGGNPDLAYVEDVLRQANETPINRRFIP